MTDILDKDSEYTKLMAPNDVFLLDRGFRDCIDE